MTSSPQKKPRDLITLVFGEKLTGEELRRQQAMLPPPPVRLVIQSLRIVILALLIATLTGLLDRIPVIGPWLDGDRTPAYVLAASLLGLIAGIEWMYQRRAESRQNDDR